MSYTMGIDVGSTYTKAVILDRDRALRGRAALPTGFQLAEAAARAHRMALEAAGLEPQDVRYVVATGFGRHQVQDVDLR
jgi:activator of 2-hydroxyglutaryl-CoA dehydratase